MNQLQPLALRPLPLGSILPRGWMENQLRIQADGLTGHLDEFWPSVAQSRWIGGPGEGWERGPYWLDGVVPLAFLLDSPRLKAKAQKWVDAIIASQDEDGWLGPRDDEHVGLGEKDHDPWPLFVVFKALIQWQEATGDERIVPALHRCALAIGKLLHEKPLDVWAKVRWGDLVWGLHWIYEQTDDERLLSIAQLAHDQGFDWKSHFADFERHYTQKTNVHTWTEDEKLPLHVVNNAMAIKNDAAWSRQSRDGSDLKSSFAILEKLLRFHGLANGMHSGDEHLAGKSPVQGVETCAVVEFLFSLEVLLSIAGDVMLGDRIERVAFNALPAAMTKSMWGRQYDQQPNQVWCSHARRDWVSNNADSNLFSLEGNFGCCTANLHQGWPKLVTHAWMGTPDDGLAFCLLQPCAVTTQVRGARVEIEVETNYPFGETLLIRIVSIEGGAKTFPLRVRIPAWARAASACINGENIDSVEIGTWGKWEREWKNGDVIELRLPQSVRVEERENEAITLLCGPLVLALPIAGETIVLRKNALEPRAQDLEVRPTEAWNFALSSPRVRDSELLRSAPAATPFSSDDPPLRARVMVRSVPEWGLLNDSAAPPPASTTCEGEIHEVELIPYGSTVLRICEFPVCE
ncbi:hypothetical protein IAD21_02358 [Abditibacteriota bacterium]|nr:hypothetical protein IAD21_02358 [Abditibacteriota bacterium]